MWANPCRHEVVLWMNDEVAILPPELVKVIIRLGKDVSDDTPLMQFPLRFMKKVREQGVIHWLQQSVRTR